MSDEKTKVQRALDHLTITPEQGRKAATLGQIGGSTGAVSGTTLGAALGATAGLMSRGKANKAIKLARGAKERNAAVKAKEALKKPGERASTGAFLGAGMGTAVGGGAGAAAGIYSGRPNRPKDGDGDGQVNEGKVKKAFDESKHERARGKFAPRAGVTEAPGARKPMSDKHKKAVANSVAALGVAGSVADAAALKAGWTESKNATKRRVTVRRVKDTPDRYKPLVRRLNSGATRGRYLAAKGSFPLQVVGLGAGLGGSYFARQAGKNQEKTVSKSVEELFSKAREDRREAGAAAAGTGLIGAGAAGEVRGRRLRADARVAQSNVHVFRPKPGLTGDFTAQQKLKVEATRAASKATGNLRAGRSAVLMGGTALGVTAVQRHNRKKTEVTKAYEETKHSRAEDGKFARQRGNSQRKLTNQKKAAQNSAAFGAGALAAGEIGGLAAERGRRNTLIRGESARRVADTSPGAQWLTPNHRKRARQIAGEAPMRAAGLKELRGVSRLAGRFYGGLGLVGAGIAASNYHESKAKHEKKFGPVTKSLEHTMSHAPDVHELFAKARERKQYEAGTAATIGGGVAGGAGSAAAGHGLLAVGQKRMNDVARGTHLTDEMGNGAATAATQRKVGSAARQMRTGTRLLKPRNAAIAAGIGATAGAAATLKEKKVAKSFDTADEVFEAVAKFEKETKHGAKVGASIGGGLGVLGGSTFGLRGMAAGGLSGAAQGGVLGAGVGGIQAHNRQKRQAKAKAARKKPTV